MNGETEKTQATRRLAGAITRLLADIHFRLKMKSVERLREEMP